MIGILKSCNHVLRLLLFDKTLLMEASTAIKYLDQVQL